MSKLYRCTVCNKKKQIHEFYLRANGTVGEYKCKHCLLEKRKQYSITNYEVVRESNRKAVSNHQKRNPDKNCEKTARYNASKKQRVPDWLSKDDLSKIKSIYKMCRLISLKTGTKHEVDHIVPINGKMCSGLHVPWNLQIITKDENLRKSNCLIEDIVYSSSRELVNI